MNQLYLLSFIDVSEVIHIGDCIYIYKVIRDSYTDHLEGVYDDNEEERVTIEEYVRNNIILRKINKNNMYLNQGLRDDETMQRYREIANCAIGENLIALQTAKVRNKSDASELPTDLIRTLKSYFTGPNQFGTKRRKSKQSKHKSKSIKKFSRRV